MLSVLEAAEKYIEAGIHIIPVRGDASRAPALEAWTPYRDRLPGARELDEWFGNRADRGVALVATGELEALDIERRDVYEAFAALVQERAPGLLSRLPRVQTPGKQGQPGDHLYYYCDDAEGSQVLA